MSFDVFVLSFGGWGGWMFVFYISVWQNGGGVKTRPKHGESCWKASDVCALGNGSLLWQLPLCRPNMDQQKTLVVTGGWRNSKREFSGARFLKFFLGVGRRQD